MNRGWIVVIFAAAGLASAYGTPHVLLRTECSMFYDRCLQDDIACAYLGIQGRRIAFPVFRGTAPRRCSKLALLPLRWPLLQWEGP